MSWKSRKRARKNKSQQPQSGPGWAFVLRPDDEPRFKREFKRSVAKAKRYTKITEALRKKHGLTI
jgi:hypothetical protein